MCAKDCMVRPGILQRRWLGELAKSLALLALADPASPAAWAKDLEDVNELDVALTASLRSGVATLVLVESDDADSMYGKRGESWNGASDDSFVGDGPELPANFPPVPQDRETVALYCEELGARTIGWLVAALEAPEGELVPGESNEAVLASLALRSLSSLTVSYAFGSFEMDIVIDALCGADVRERLDRLALRIVDLPALEWWSEEFDPDHYEYHCADLRYARVVAPGHPVPAQVLRANGRGLPSKERRRLVSGIKAIDKEFGDLPRIMETSWFPASQFAAASARSYRTTNPLWIAPTREELRINLANFAAHDPGVVEERYLEERAWSQAAVCTGQILGDDAGDLPLKALTRCALDKRDYRIATIHSTRDWTDLVARFPAVMMPTGASDTQETWSGDAQGVWLTIDWNRASRELDGVYLSVLGSLEAAYVPLRLAVPGPQGERECWTMMTGWVPGSVLWLNDPLDSWPKTPEWNFEDVTREYEEALAELKKGRDFGEK